MFRANTWVKYRNDHGPTSIVRKVFYNYIASKPIQTPDIPGNIDHAPIEAAM